MCVYEHVHIQCLYYSVPHITNKSFELMLPESARKQNQYRDEEGRLLLEETTTFFDL